METMEMIDPPDYIVIGRFRDDEPFWDDRSPRLNLASKVASSRNSRGMLGRCGSERCEPGSTGHTLSLRSCPRSDSTNVELLVHQDRFAQGSETPRALVEFDISLGAVDGESNRGRRLLVGAARRHAPPSPLF